MKSPPHSSVSDRSSALCADRSPDDASRDRASAIFDAAVAGDTYEIPDIIQNGVNGFVSDDINTLRGYVEFLLQNRDAAKRIGRMGRETAIELFGKENVKLAWSKFLGRFGTMII
jgi:glycosyltransferase involved in cell wall biosynthesis